MSRLPLSLGLLLAAPALAQETATTFDGHGIVVPTGDGDLRDPLTLWRAERQVRGSWGAWGTFEYANNPLVQHERTPEGDVFREPLLAHVFGLHVAGQYSPHERVGIAADLPLWFTSTGLDGTQGIAAGDLSLSVPVGILLPREGEGLSVGLSAVPFLRAPTGATARFLGTDGFSGGGSLVTTLQGGRFSGTVQVGAEGQPASDLDGLLWGSQLMFGGSFGALITERVAVHAELAGRHVFAEQAQPSLGTPMELALTARGRNRSGLRMHGGVATSLTPGASAAVLRLFAGAGWTFGKDLAPLDADLDGIADRADACPAEPEDMDGFEDADGCPDLDNDADGIVDERDLCPMQAEDTDDFEDLDGCPDLDNDADGIVDTADACPLDREDADGFEDEDGCPDLDNDGDGIADGDDMCIDKPEDGKAPNATDGCPTDVKTVLTKEKIVILDKVRFNTNRATLRPDAYAILDSVAETLLEHPEIQKIRIEGHTDHQGNDDFNQHLSERRAVTVRNYLISKGVHADRLVSEGYGESSPIATNDTAEGREQNRRVEFMVVGEGDANKETDKQD